MATITREAHLAQLPRMVAALSCNDAPMLLDVVTQFRKLLSLEVNPPIEEVIAAGVVPRLVQFLTHDQLPQLQFEAAWALTNIASGASEQARVVVEASAVPLFVRLMRSPSDELREQASWALGNLAGDSPQFRDVVLQHGAMSVLLQAVVESSKLSMLRNATWTISNLCRGKPAPPYDLVSLALPVLARLLYSTDDEVLTDACWALSYLSDGPNERIQAVIDTGVCRRLVELLASGSFAVQTPALRTVGNIVTGDDMQTQYIINISILSVLPSLLTSAKKSIRKEACWTLSNITAGNRSHIQAVIEANIFPHLVALLGEADLEVAVQTAWAISNATSGGTPEQMRYLVEQAGCLRPLCALLGCGDDKIVVVVLEALHNILSAGAREAGASGSGSGSNRYAMYVTELGVVDKVVQLQSHSNDDIRDKAVRLLGVFHPGDASTNDDADVDMDGDTGRPAWARAGQQASSNVFSFGTFHAALP